MIKGVVLNVELKKSKKDTVYQKLLVKIGDTVCGYCFDFGTEMRAEGDTVEFTVGTDYQNYLRLEVK